MDFEIRRQDSAVVMIPAGDIVASSTPPLRGAMRDLVRSGVGDLTIDLERTEMIDSTGLGLLISAFNSLQASGGRFQVINASEEILDLFRTMRMHQHFSIKGR